MSELQVAWRGTPQGLDPAASYRVSLVRVSDNYVLDVVDAEFVDPEAVEDLDTIQAVLSESAQTPGLWRGTLEIPDDASGDFQLHYIDNTGMLAGHVSHAVVPVVLYDGAPRVDTAQALTALSDQTPGLDLVARDPAGLALDAVDVRVYTFADAQALAWHLPVGVTSTNAQGRWVAPVWLAPGATYTVVFSKPPYGVLLVNVTL